MWPQIFYEIYVCRRIIAASQVLFGDIPQLVIIKAERETEKSNYIINVHYDE